MSEPAAVYVDPDVLIPWDDNPRKNDKAAKRLSRTIAELGFGAPIVAQSTTHRIIAGHTRWKAAKILGLDSVPVRYMDVSDRTANALALADNAEGLSGTWDDVALAQQLAAFSLDEADTMGWDEDALAKLADSVPDFGPLDEGDGERCEACGKKL